jgi:glucokinase
VLLAGDIGGTNARMALFSKKEGIKCSLVEDVYPTKDFDSI